MTRYDQGGAEHNKRRIGKPCFRETPNEDDHDARTKQRETGFLPMDAAVGREQTGATDHGAGCYERPFEALFEQPREARRPRWRAAKASPHSGARQGRQQRFLRSPGIWDPYALLVC
jgi:hypothetical protein